MCQLPVAFLCELGGQFQHKNREYSMKFFNRAGSIRPRDHYHLNPLERFDFEDFIFLIEEKTILSSLRISRKNNHRLRNVRKIIIQQARDEGGNFIFIRKE
jgi:hypothetical protein